jgi:putative membrane protein
MKEGHLMRSPLAIAAAVALLLSSAAYAQQPAPAPTQQPEPGANSFTEAQAKSRLEAAGYSNVSALRKDDQGIWRGTAMKDGKQVNVAVDFRGNITLS